MPPNFPYPWLSAYSTAKNEEVEGWLPKNSHAKRSE